MATYIETPTTNLRGIYPENIVIIPSYNGIRQRFIVWVLCLQMKINALKNLTHI